MASSGDVFFFTSAPTRVHSSSSTTHPRAHRARRYDALSARRPPPQLFKLKRTGGRVELAALKQALGEMLAMGAQVQEVLAPGAAAALPAGLDARLGACTSAGRVRLLQFAEHVAQANVLALRRTLREALGNPRVSARLRRALATTPSAGDVHRALPTGTCAAAPLDFLLAVHTAGNSNAGDSARHAPPPCPVGLPTLPASRCVCLSLDEDHCRGVGRAPRLSAAGVRGALW